MKPSRFIRNKNKEQYHLPPPGRLMVGIAGGMLCFAWAYLHWRMRGPENHYGMMAVVIFLLGILSLTGGIIRPKKFNPENTTLPFSREKCRKRRFISKDEEKDEKNTEGGD